MNHIFSKFCLKRPLSVPINLMECRGGPFRPFLFGTFLPGAICALTAISCKSGSSDQAGGKDGISVDTLCQLPTTMPSPIAVAMVGSNSLRTYSVADSGSFQWVVPESWTIVSGQGTNSLAVDATTTDGAQQVSVTFTNECGAGPARVVLESSSLSVASTEMNESCQLKVNGSYVLEPEATLTSSTAESTYGQVQEVGGDRVLLGLPLFAARTFDLTWNIGKTRSSHSLTIPFEIIRSPASTLGIPASLTAATGPSSGWEISSRAAACGGSCVTGRRASISSDKHVCLVNADSTVSCWGRNALGRLGDGTTIDRLSPVLVKEGGSTLTGIVAVGVDHDHSCVLTEDGLVKCWGNNGNGQLGNNSLIGSLTAVTVVNSTATGNLSGVVKLRTGLRSACGILNDGTLQCWGWAIRATGYNTTYSRPKAIAGLGTGTVVDVGIGYGHTCAVMSTGKVMCWGGISNPTEGELGNGSLLPAYTDPGQLGPREVVGITDAVQVVSGEYYSCALHAGGTVSCWGKANLLGDESASNRSTPGPVPGLTDVVGLSRVTFGICATRGSGWNGPQLNGHLL